MKLSELNESTNFDTIANNGVVVYFDKTNKTFAIATDDEAKKIKGNLEVVKTKRDYAKIARKYDVDTTTDDWINLSKEASKIKDRKFKNALNSMMNDIEKMSKK